MENRTEQEERLDIFVGEWRNSGELKPALFGTGGPITGTTNYGWEMGSIWLIYGSQLSLPGLGSYQVRGGIRFNREAGKYEAYAVNSLGALIVYEGEWQDESTLAFISVYPMPAGRARVVYQAITGDRIRMSSEAMNDEGEFKPYFITDMEHL